ncbi:NAD(P)-binding domain-containing protein [bacterium]|nr:NAD(P)-binding domain-containing protein [bacterium]
MIDWLIIGGGVHGLHLLVVLAARLGAAGARVRLVDAHGTPLARFNECASNTGMTHLRSPSVHHVALRDFPIERFVATPRGRGFRDFAGPYSRPSLALFLAHARAAIERYRVAPLIERATVSGLARMGGGLRAETDRGAIDARRVLLALSPTDTPRVPEWGRHLSPRRVRHIFEPGFLREEWEHESPVVVIGGGLSAYDTAINHAVSRPGEVTLISRRESEVHDFDSDPGWLGPKFLRGFHQEPDLVRRREIIERARYRGSVTPDAAERLESLERDGRVTHRLGAVTRATEDADGVTLALSDGREVRAGSVILDTGFGEKRPGGAWLDRVIDDFGLPLAPDGFPRVNYDLSWGNGIHVTGALAELELGPAARNIAGARAAGERLAAIAEI